MLKVVERFTGGNVHVEIDAPQGRILLVQCPDHGGMALRLANPAWVCQRCGCEFSKDEAQQLIDACYAEIIATDKATNRQERVDADQRLQERFANRRDQKG